MRRIVLSALLPRIAYFPEIALRYVGAMADDPDDQYAALVSRPAETIAVELKTWIDPRTPEGIDKIVRGAFALRNRDGGFMLFGFNDKTRLPDPYPFSEPVEKIFHPDDIQRIVTRFASQELIIEVHFRERDGQSYPVMSIPPGVRVPVIVKSDLAVPGKRGLAVGDIFFRTLRANNTVSSAPIKIEDFPALIEICFNNREADIGGFFRRQLGQANIAALVAALSQFAGFGSTAAQEEPDLEKRAFAYLGEGLASYEKAAQQSGAGVAALYATRLTMQVGLVLSPQQPGAVPTHEFLERLANANPQYSGWPIWLDSRRFRDSSSHPQVIDGAWQALIVSLETSWSKHIDFMRLDPSGRFYLRRVMQDDMVENRSEGRSLDVFLMLFRVAEVFAVGVSFARALGWENDASAGFAFRWTGLKDRQLDSWANPTRMIAGNYKSAMNEAESFVSVGVGTPHNALAPYLFQAVKPLFAVFDGFLASQTAVEDAVRLMVERKMG